MISSRHLHADLPEHTCYGHLFGARYLLDVIVLPPVLLIIDVLSHLNAYRSGDVRQVKLNQPST